MGVPLMNDSLWRRFWSIAALALLLTAASLALAGCYEPASTWSEKQGRYRPTDEVQREIVNDEIDKRELERERYRNRQN